MVRYIIIETYIVGPSAWRFRKILGLADGSTEVVTTANGVAMLLVCKFG